jgi:hypothetical protein
MKDGSDELVPDPRVAEEFEVSLMTLWRWSRDSELGFPPALQIRRRNYRSRGALDEFKARLVRAAVHRRDCVTQAT